MTTKDKSKRDSTIPPVATLSILDQNLESTNEASIATQVGIGITSGDAPGAPGIRPRRRKLKLLPRRKPSEEKKSEDTSATLVAKSDDDGRNSHTMSESEAKTRIDEDSKEFFTIRDLEEAEVYFTKLPVEHRHLLVDKLVSCALEAKEADAELVATYFARAVCKSLCPPEGFEQGFAGTAEFLDDIAVDAPKAPQYFIKMLKGSALDKDEKRCAQLLSKSMDSEKLLNMLA